VAFDAKHRKLRSDARGPARAKDKAAAPQSYLCTSRMRTPQADKADGPLPSALPKKVGGCFLTRWLIGSRPRSAQRRSAMTRAGGKHLQRPAPSALHDLPRRGRSQGAGGTPRPCAEIRRVFLRLPSSLVRRPSDFPANPNSQIPNNLSPLTYSPLLRRPAHTRSLDHLITRSLHHPRRYTQRSQTEGTE
jgi:hypothetical protein